MIALWWTGCASAPPEAPEGTWYLLRPDIALDSCPAQQRDGRSGREQKKAWELWYDENETALLELDTESHGGVSGYFVGEDANGPVDGRRDDGVAVLDVFGNPGELTWTARTVTLTLSWPDEDVVWQGERCSFEERCDDRCYR